MNDSVIQFREFGIVPTIGSTYQITGDALQLIDVLASALRTSFQVRSRVLIAAFEATIAVMVYRTVSDVVLIHHVHYTHNDFWASWCGPCRREMPNLVEAYAKYKNKGFEIVGVSLDQSGEAWKEAIEKLNITWPQMSDLKYWNCEGAQLYAVSSIPHTVLIDGEGTIIARGLHGEELQEKLAEVIK